MIENSRRIAILALLPWLVLGGCAGSSDRYPSLSVRDFERTPDATVEQTSLTPQPASEETGRLVAGALAAAEDAHQAFIAASTETDRIVGAAAGLGVEDNAWSAAQIALAELDSMRGTTAVALGDLDQLFSNATLDFVDRDGIAEVRDKVAGLIAQEDQTLERLRNQLDR